MDSDNLWAFSLLMWQKDTIFGITTLWCHAENCKNVFVSNLRHYFSCSYRFDVNKPNTLIGGQTCRSTKRKRDPIVSWRKVQHPPKLSSIRRLKFSMNLNNPDSTSEITLLLLFWYMPLLDLIGFTKSVIQLLQQIWFQLERKTVGLWAN